MGQIKLSQLRQYIDVCIVRDAVIESIGFLDINYSNKDLIYVSDDNDICLIQDNKRVSAMIVSESMLGKITKDTLGIIVSDNPKKLFFEIHNKLVDIKFYHKDIVNRIDASASVSDQVYIAPKNVIIGKNVVIEPNVTINENVIIGNNCHIGAGTVIGSKLFKYYRDSECNIPMKSAGWVVISDCVDIISNVCVEAGIVDDTIIGKNSVINSLVNVGHSVKIGNNVAVSAGSVIAGSTIVEDDVWIGLNATIRQKIHIGKSAYVCMGAVVSKDVQAGGKVSGNFAVEHSKNIANVKKIANAD